MQQIDHPIFIESIRLIKARLGSTGLTDLEQMVLERLIHSSGDFQLAPLLSFSPRACQLGLSALTAGAPILADTSMAAAGVRPMALRTLNTSVRSVLEWAPLEARAGSTRTAEGMELAWKELSSQFAKTCSPIVLIGSAPTAMNALLDLVNQGAAAPSLIIGMPVGFVGVLESKKRLANSGLPYILLNGNRGGSGLVAGAVNALLRASQISN